MNSRKIIFVFPKWPDNTLWGNFLNKFPALGLLTLAGVTPPGFEVELLDENVDPINFEAEVDLVAISVMTPLAPRAYAIADEFRRRGRAVIMGGIHPTWLPDEAGAHADSVVMGEADEIWPRVLDDFANGRLQARYHVSEPVDLDRVVPLPRRDLLAPGAYLIRSTIQLTRGCPYDCDYCSVTAFSGRKFRHRPVDEFVAEYRGLPDRFVFIVDDHILSNRKVAESLFERLRGSGKWWGSQVTPVAGDDDELLKTMARSGCRLLFVGFESLNQDNLDLVNKKFVKAALSAERIKRIHGHGIAILGSFIVGLDHDDDRVFDQLYEFITVNRIESFIISLPTPFPGTRMTRRMEEEGRILTRDWSRYDMTTVVFRPKNFRPEKLQEKYDRLNLALYSLSSIARRAIKPRVSMLICLPQNLGLRRAWKRRLSTPRS